MQQYTYMDVISKCLICFYYNKQQCSYFYNIFNIIVVAFKFSVVFFKQKSYQQLFNKMEVRWLAISITFIHYVLCVQSIILLLTTKVYIVTIYLMYYRRKFNKIMSGVSIFRIFDQFSRQQKLQQGGILLLISYMYLSCNDNNIYNTILQQFSFLAIDNYNFHIGNQAHNFQKIKKYFCIQYRGQ
eukprot:TRINITY_DN2630_c1_g1_i2.p2 TRINITY_DN2630_c1_g1~~TRINITY_DN2630_c1_g1_i2.p2  ORF type:complete len:185 (+),score=-12.20 TRINITY_DN2630_c1_g1_i2:313-867(+)